jgi:CheY-like chemotaxis protein
MTRVLVVEDSRTQAIEIRLLLHELAYQTEVATNGREALQALKEKAFNVVLTDLDMPVMNGLELVEAVRKEHPGLPVVLMTAVGSEEIAVQALRKGASHYIPKRILSETIATTLEDILLVARTDWSQQQLLSCLTQADFSFVLENDPALVSPLIAHLEPHLARLQPSDRTERVRVSVALHEALLNAIQHGNLEVSSELRQKDERVFRDECERRRHQEPYSSRRVRVRARLGRDEAVLVIADEGPGFNPKTLPDPTDPANLERVGGRGLMLIRTFMDHVEHNATGNQITLVKRPARR